MKRLLLATIALILAGCSDDDPATQLAKCKIEAIRLWPKEDASASFRKEGDEGAKRISGEHFRNHSDEYVPICMQAHGYHQNVRPDACKTYSPFDTQAACYEKVRR
jgi:hypothetical protein